MGQITYDWKIHPNLSVIYSEQNLQNVVNEVMWTYQGDYIPDGQSTPTISKGIRQSTKLTSPDVNSFIPFENLTQQIIKDWLNSMVSTDTIAEMQQRLSASIASEIAPVSGIMQAPWV